jgi:hypothetical protein
MIDQADGSGGEPVKSLLTPASAVTWGAFQGLGGGLRFKQELAQAHELRRSIVEDTRQLELATWTGVGQGQMHTWGQRFARDAHTAAAQLRQEVAGLPQSTPSSFEREAQKHGRQAAGSTVLPGGGDVDKLSREQEVELCAQLEQELRSSRQGHRQQLEQ